MEQLLEEHFQISGYNTLRNIISALDIILALIIILTASQIIQTPLGGAALIFGFIMLSIVTTLKIFQQW